MIVTDKVNRFEPNIGKNLNSIALASNWTNSRDATNIEQAGKAFSVESDFGDGLTGGRGLGTLSDLFNGAGISNIIPNPLEWDWHEWLLAVGGGYTLYKMMFSETGKKRRELSKNEREIYKNQLGEVKKKYKARKAIVAKDHPLFSF